MRKHFPITAEAWARLSDDLSMIWHHGCFTGRDVTCVMAVSVMFGVVVGVAIGRLV